MKKSIILTGDRPTGSLHIGHYAGTLESRVKLQKTDKYQMYVMIADLQALTDNFDNPEKIQNSILELTLDYLAVGLDPEKTSICVQSGIPALTELPMYYANLVTMSRLERNPTVKQEIKGKGFGHSLPVGFVTYPISQAADITAFKAEYVPCGDDQLPMIEQAKEIVASFNRIYKCSVLVEPKPILPARTACFRLVGTDGAAKMSKSMGNCIYIKDDEKTTREKVMSMYTDPLHINVSDPGHTENNPVFIYLEAFSSEEHFAEYLPEYACLDEMKEHYEKGGLGDMKCKKFLNNVLRDTFASIRRRREDFAKDKGELLNILKKGTSQAADITGKTLTEVRNAIGINYFENAVFLNKLRSEAV